MAWLLIGTILSTSTYNIDLILICSPVTGKMLSSLQQMRKSMSRRLIAHSSKLAPAAARFSMFMCVHTHVLTHTGRLRMTAESWFYYAMGILYALSTVYVQCPRKPEEGTEIPWNWSYRLWSTVWVLGIGFSGSAAITSGPGSRFLLPCGRNLIHPVRWGNKCRLPLSCLGRG